MRAAASASRTELRHALPSRDLRPLRRHARMATAMVKAGDKSPILDRFHLCHAHSGDDIRNGFEHVGRHGEMARRVAANIAVSHARLTASRLRNRWNAPRCVRSSVPGALDRPNVTRVSASISRPPEATPDRSSGRERPTPTIKEETIATAAPGSMPEPEDILAMSEADPDGGGVGWWDGERLRVFKNVDPFIYSHWRRLRDAPCLIHFAAHGAVEPRDRHPFHTDRGYVAHDGIACDYEVGPHASDSCDMVGAWVESGYDDSVFDGQGYVALITLHGCLKWLEGDPVELSRGVWVSNMWWNV